MNRHEFWKLLQGWRGPNQAANVNPIDFAPCLKEYGWDAVEEGVWVPDPNGVTGVWWVKSAEAGVEPYPVQLAFTAERYKLVIWRTEPRDGVQHTTENTTELPSHKMERIERLIQAHLDMTEHRGLRLARSSDDSSMRISCTQCYQDWYVGQATIEDAGRSYLFYREGIAELERQLLAREPLPVLTAPTRWSRLLEEEL